MIKKCGSHKLCTHKTQQSKPPGSPLGSQAEILPRWLQNQRPATKVFQPSPKCPSCFVITFSLDRLPEASDLRATFLVKEAKVKRAVAEAKLCETTKAVIQKIPVALDEPERRRNLTARCWVPFCKIKDVIHCWLANMSTADCDPEARIGKILCQGFHVNASRSVDQDLSHALVLALEITKTMGASSKLLVKEPRKGAAVPTYIELVIILLVSVVHSSCWIHTTIRK